MSKIATNLLSALDVKRAKPKDTTDKLKDGAGLFWVIEPNGKKWWKYRAVFAKKETSFSFGEYPLVTLAQARVERGIVDQMPFYCPKDPVLSKCPPSEGWASPCQIECHVFYKSLKFYEPLTPPNRTESLRIQLNYTGMD